MKGGRLGEEGCRRGVGGGVKGGRLGEKGEVSGVEERGMKGGERRRMNARVKVPSLLVFLSLLISLSISIASVLYTYFFMQVVFVSNSHQ